MIDLRTRLKLLGLEHNLGLFEENPHQENQNQPFRATSIKLLLLNPAGQVKEDAPTPVIFSLSTPDPNSKVLQTWLIQEAGELDPAVA